MFFLPRLLRRVSGFYRILCCYPFYAGRKICL
nr:MAG TPA: hypothetical protein [Caudoviricetes sp.]